MWGAGAAPGTGAARTGCRAPGHVSASRASTGRPARPAKTAATASTVTRVPLSCDHPSCDRSHWRPLLTCCVPAECRCQHGRCRDGVDGDGTCECHLGWRGVLCDQSRSTHADTRTSCTHTHTHACTDTHMHAHTHPCTHINTHPCTHTGSHTHTRTNTGTHATRARLMHLGHVTSVTSVLVSSSRNRVRRPVCLCQVSQQCKVSLAAG